MIKCKTIFFALAIVCVVSIAHAANLKNVWRFECDPNGDPDPIVRVYLQTTVIVDGETFIKQDMTPVLMRFSELTGGLSDLVDANKIAAKKAEKGVVSPIEALPIK